MPFEIRPFRCPVPMVAALLPALALAALPAGAQPFPSKSLRIVVPYAPGGVVDYVGRTLGQKLSEQLGQSVVIDNRGGAGGMVGAEVAARAGADGYTMLVMDPAIVINQSLQPQVPYDVLKDFRTITIVTSSPLVLAINPKVGARSVAELAAIAKAKPGTLSFASAGIGTTPHMAGEFFKSRIAQDIVHVPYKGSGPAMTDLIAGNVQMTFSSIAAAIPFFKDNRLLGLATTGPKRVAALSDLPTMVEAGFAGFEVELAGPVRAFGHPEGHRRPPACRDGEGAGYGRAARCAGQGRQRSGRQFAVRGGTVRACGAREVGEAGEGCGHQAAMTRKRRNDHG